MSFIPRTCLPCYFFSLTVVAIGIDPSTLQCSADLYAERPVLFLRTIFSIHRRLLLFPGGHF